jgi:predicted GNAT superfamily acetyltransferase
MGPAAVHLPAGKRRDVNANVGTDGIAAGWPGAHANPHAIEIEELQGIAGAREVERLQMQIWTASEGWIVPSHALLIVAEYGGILLGARVNDAMVGFVLGFLARSGGTLFHASHMLGVLPESQQHGVGSALKWRQRDVARRQGLDLMRWTFDPLESRNAYFNFHKLGTVCRSYRMDYYGPMQDALNRDLPSDRLIVEWHLRDGRPRPDGTGPGQTILRDGGEGPELRLDAMGGGGPLAIEIPADVQSMKREAPETALAWRLAVREAFTAALDAGYTACDFRDGAYRLVRSGERRHAH